MKYSTEYYSSGLLYAGCTQEYILNLLSLYRICCPCTCIGSYFRTNLWTPINRTLLCRSCELTWQSSHVCSFGFIQKFFPSACRSHFPQPQTFSKIPAKFTLIFQILWLILCILF